MLPYSFRKTHPPMLQNLRLGASSDVRPYLGKADEPVEAKDESTLSKMGHKESATAFYVGLQ